MSAWEPLIVMVAPNGARKTQTDHPALPLTPDELAATAVACRDAGAALLHLHVRDAAGQHTLDPARYRTAMQAIRQAVGAELIIQMTTEAVGRYQPAEQMAAVRELVPEAVSLAVRELVADSAQEAAFADFAAWLRRERILTQYIVYSAADINRLAELCARGIVPDERPNVLCVLGRYSQGQTSEPTELLPFLAALPAGWRWAVCAFGPKEGACALAAAILGGQARIGFENNLYLSDGACAPDNAALVTQLARGAALIGRPLATAATARALLA